MSDGICVLVGEYLVFSPSRLNIFDFRAWTLRMTNEGRKRRRLQPVAVGEAGGLTLVFDGMDSVWSLLDALHEGLPRSYVTEDMKSHESPFREILAELIKESETPVLIAKIREKRVENRWGCEAYEVLRIYPSEEVDIPLRDRSGIVYSKSEVMRKGDDYIVISHLNDGRTLAMGIAMRGERGVLRPFPAKVFDSEDDALKYAQQNSHLFSNIRDVSKSYSLSVGMFSVETDRIEHSRFLRDYVSTE
jgi:hypothetical protein